MVQFKIDEFFDIKSIEKAVQLFEQLMEDRFYVNNTGISYRTINHWDEKGLIRCNRKKEGGDRRFSFIDFVWVKIVNELRTFGVSVPIVKKITNEIYETMEINELFESVASNLHLFDDYHGQDKEEIFNFVKNKEYENHDFSDSGITFLHLLIADAIAGREPMSIIVFKDGEWYPYNPAKEKLYSEEIINKKRFSSHISICLLDIIFQFFQSDTVIQFMRDFKLFTPLEQKLLDEVEAGAFKKVKVVYKTKKYASIEIKKSKTTKTQLLQIIRDRQYSNFIITDIKGKDKKLIV